MALTVGRELLITMSISYSELKSPVCVLNCGVKEILCQAECGRASYNREYENAAGKKVLKYRL